MQQVFFIGAANTVPGISGGSIALIFGIYEKLVFTLAQIKPRAIYNKFKAADATHNIEWHFLLKIIFGVFLGVASCSLFIPALMQNFQAQMNALFLGLMLASIPHVIRYFPKRLDFSNYFIIIISALVAFSFSALPTLTLSGHGLWHFFIGMIAIAAMLLPGISGSFILVVFGVYSDIFVLINRALRFDFSAIIALLPFCLGIFFGAVLFIRLINFLLRKYKSSTLSILIGLMVGSMSALWPFTHSQQNYLAMPTSFGIDEIYILLLFVVGIILGCLTNTCAYEKN